MRERQPQDTEDRTVEHRSKIEARVVELCLIALLLLTIVAVVSGRIGFVGAWGHVGGVGDGGRSPALDVPPGGKQKFGDSHVGQRGKVRGPSTMTPALR